MKYDQYKNEEFAALIIGKQQQKCDLIYQKWIDKKINNLFKIKNWKKLNEECIDPFGLVKKLNTSGSVVCSSKIAVVSSAWMTYDYIEDFFNSLQNNSMQPNIVLLGVDGCKQTLNKAISIAKKYDFEIHVFYSEENVGTYVIRNELNRIAFEEYESNIIVCFDSDDMLHENYIECAANFLLENPNSIICPNVIVEFDAKKISIKKYDSSVNCFTRKTWEKIGNYLPFRAGADTEWLHRACKLQTEIFVCDSMVQYRRMHKNQLTKILPISKNQIERQKSIRIIRSELILHPFNKPIELIKIDLNHESKND